MILGIANRISPKKNRTAVNGSEVLTDHFPLSEAEITQRIFNPGFSTAAQVSAISGCGVGGRSRREYSGVARQGGG